MVGLARYSAALRLPTLGYTFVLPFNHGAIARVISEALATSQRPPPDFISRSRNLRVLDQGGNA